jgi:hypothetical protein
MLFTTQIIALAALVAGVSACNNYNDCPGQQVCCCTSSLSANPRLALLLRLLISPHTASLPSHADHVLSRLRTRLLRTPPVHAMRGYREQLLQGEIAGVEWGAECGKSLRQLVCELSETWYGQSLEKEKSLWTVAG